jgi:hypothetical protein
LPSRSAQQRRPVFALRATTRQPSLAARAKAGGQGMDLNLRTPKGRDLQSRCFGRLHTCPNTLVAGRGVAPRSRRLMRPFGSLTDQPASKRHSTKPALGLGAEAGSRQHRLIELAEGEGVEPSTVRSARFSGPVACRHAPPPNWSSRKDSNLLPRASDTRALSR